MPGDVLHSMGTDTDLSPMELAGSLENVRVHMVIK